MKKSEVKSELVTYLTDMIATLDVIKKDIEGALETVDDLPLKDKTVIQMGRAGSIRVEKNGRNYSLFCNNIWYMYNQLERIYAGKKFQRV